MKLLNTQVFQLDFKHYFTYGSAMLTNLDTLENLVTRAEERLDTLRSEVERLQTELRERPVPRPERGPSGIADENRRLLEERALVLERIRGLIGEIDRAL